MAEFTRPITIKDIAREAGVSKATVSYALRGNPKIGEATQDRVRRIAKKLGYQRNPAYAALGSMAHRNATSRDGLPIGYLHQRDQYGVEHFNPEIFRGVERRCSELGYRVEPFLLDDFASPAALLKQIVNRGLSGLIFGQITDLDFLQSPQLNRCALVAAGIYRQALPVHTVRASRYAGARQTLLETYARGYRRILVLQLWHEEKAMTEDFGRYAGILAAQRQLELECEDENDDSWVRMVPRRGIDHIFLQKMIEKYQPDAVIGFNSSDYYGIRAAGYSDPQQLGFAAEEMDPSQTPEFNVAGISSCNEDIGDAAVEWIDQLIRFGQFGLPKMVQSKGFEPRWVDGETLPDRK